MAIEDIWLRLMQHCPVKLSAQQGIFELTFVGLKTATVGGHASQLRTLATKRNTYTWHEDAHRGEFIDSIEYQGDDLILQLKPMSHIQRWPDGGNMACQVKSFLLRLPELVSRQSTSQQSNLGGNAK